MLPVASAKSTGNVKHVNVRWIVDSIIKSPTPANQTPILESSACSVSCLLTCRIKGAHSYILSVGKSTSETFKNHEKIEKILALQKFPTTNPINFVWRPIVYKFMQLKFCSWDCDGERPPCPSTHERIIGIIPPRHIQNGQDHPGQPSNFLDMSTTIVQK